MPPPTPEHNYELSASAGMKIRYIWKRNRNRSAPIIYRSAPLTEWEMTTEPDAEEPSHVADGPTTFTDMLQGAVGVATGFLGLATTKWAGPIVAPAAVSLSAIANRLNRREFKTNADAIFSEHIQTLVANIANMFEECQEAADVMELACAIDTEKTYQENSDIIQNVRDAAQKIDDIAEKAKTFTVDLHHSIDIITTEKDMRLALAANEVLKSVEILANNAKHDLYNAENRYAIATS